MKKVLAALMVAVLLMGFASVAYAWWIWEDPILSIAGTEVNIEVGIDLPEGASTPPTDVYVFVPRNVEAYVIDDGGANVTLIKLPWDAHGRKVRFRTVVFVHNPAPHKHVPVNVVLTAGSKTWTRHGRSGIPIVIKAYVPAP